MNSIIKTIFLLLLIICSCKEINNTNALFNVEPEQIKKNTDIQLSLLLDKYCFIKLETSEKSLIGNIDKIVKRNGLIFISSSRKTVSIFNNEGKFINEIEKIGKGPGEYIELIDFDIYSNHICILTYKKIQLYELNGDFFQTITLPFVAKKFKYTRKGNIVFQTSNEKDAIAVTNFKGEKINSFLRTNIANRISKNVPFINLGQDKVIFQIANTNDYVCYDENNNKFSIEKILVNSNAIDVKHYELLLEKYGSEANKHFNNYLYIDGISSCFQKLFFGYIINNQIYCGLYDYKTRKGKDFLVYPKSNILDDITFTDSQFLGLTSSSQSDSSFISYIYLDKVKEGFENYEKKYPQYIQNTHFKTVKEIIDKSQIEDNPLLIEFTFK